MLPAVDAAHVKSMYSSRSTSWRVGSDMTRHTAKSWHSREPSNYNQQWHPLGSTWRERSTFADGTSRRLNVDDATEFVDGCLPAYGKGRNMRTVAALEQRLTWAYYKMRQLPQPPEMQIDREGIPQDVQMGTQFRFWSDLKPPIKIQKVQKDVQQDEADAGAHPDGVLYKITYCCPLDYVIERKWGTNRAEGTFDNTVRGYATVRIPKEFPRKPLVVLSWGNPSLLFDYRVSEKLHGTKAEAQTVSPKIWSPLAAELNLRPDMPRLAELRVTCERVDNKQKQKAGLKTRATQKTLYGPTPSPSLPGFAKADQSDSGDKKKKMRQFGMHTACGGFVRFDG